MDTAYSEQQEAFRHSLRRWVEEHAGPAFTRAHWAQAAAMDAERWSALAALGITGVLVPEATGGLGGGMSDIGVVMEELGRGVVPAPVWGSCIGATSLAARFGLNDLLAGLADGRLTAAVAVAEPGRRITGWRQPATAARDGLLYGDKTEVPDAIGAAQLFVTAQDGIYLLDTAAPGVAITAMDCIDGSRALANVSLQGAPGTRLGPLDAFAPVLDRMLIALCADGIGAAGRALELTVAYAGERKQFGQPIGAFQAVQHLCADMLQQLELGRAALHYALWAGDAADTEGAEARGHNGAETRRVEAHRAAVMCKAYLAEVLPQFGANTIQVFGGAGFTWEYDAQLYYKRLLSVQMLWGSAEVWLEELATLVLDADAPAIVPD